jgi:hypothetical protein
MDRFQSERETQSAPAQASEDAHEILERTVIRMVTKFLVLLVLDKGDDVDEVSMPNREGEDVLILAKEHHLGRLVRSHSLDVPVPKREIDLVILLFESGKWEGMSEQVNDGPFGRNHPPPCDPFAVESMLLLQLQPLPLVEMFPQRALDPIRSDEDIYFYVLVRSLSRLGRIEMESDGAALVRGVGGAVMVKVADGRREFVDELVEEVCTGWGQESRRG